MGNFNNELKNYQNIPRDLIFDSAISDRARFVFCYMASKKEDWDFYLKPMAKEIGYSEDTLRKYINELVSSGWLSKGKQVCNENGTFGAVKYTLHSKKTDTVNTDTEKYRYGETMPLKERDNIKKIDNIKERKKIEDKSSIEKVPTDLDWRASFSIYKQLVFEARNQLKYDNEFKTQMAKYNPNADYELSIDKSVDLFWGTEQGWEHCKKSKSKKINMLSALKKNFDKNIVYKQWNKKGQVKTTVAENDNEQIMLPDGTFKMNGYRYYYSRLNGRTFSIPIKALPMPQDGEYEYDLKMGWYKVD